jgi:two-component system CheB/CheR fusion protein
MESKKTKSARKSRSRPARNKNNAAPKRKSTQSASYEDLSVVGIGASAGGLEALRSFILHLPPLDNVACVVAQHLDPKHHSILGELLARDTDLEVVEVRHNDWIRPKAIFVTPFDRHITIANGRFRLIKPTTSSGPKPSVDYFFTSLAQEKGEKAVAIILSGTGSDGAHGVRAVKAAGGITIVQDLKTAKYNGMPQSSIDTGLVDLILAPEEMGPALPSLIESPRVARKAIPADDARFNVRAILSMLQERIGCDFSEYKSTTINRRIERRMVLRKITSLKDYIRYLRTTPQELHSLHKDILIAVTSFFRDPEAFDALSRCITKIVKAKKPGDTIRFWIAGCATGEEAYSIAILLAQALHDQGSNRSIQIFATDLDDEGVERARKGIYPEAMVVNIDGSMLDRYFVSHDHTFRVNKSIREMLIFAKQNLISDPPFSGLDLVVCRNVLIYFSSRLQNRLLSMFHYVLNDAGYLFLGKSESVGPLSSLFSQVDRKWKIYKRRETFRQQHVDFGIGQAARFRPPPYQKPIAPGKEFQLRDVTNQAIANAYGPKAVVIDDRLEVVFVRGDVSPYLRLSAGEAGLNILDMVRTDVRMELRTLIHRAVRARIPVRGTQHQLTDGDTDTLFRILVTSVSSTDETEQLILVVFEEQTIKAPDLPAPDKEKQSHLDPHIRALEQELATTREYLQTTVEELETANEELQSANEELQSTNEELHSSNEELQTANEELQSANEELATVNQELQVRSTELINAHTDIDNIISSVGFALIVVDRHLRVQRFTPDTTKLFALSGIFIGEPLAKLTSQAHLPDLHKEIMTVIDQAAVSEQEITTEHNTYWLTIAPYYSYEKIAVGAILTFFDRTERKRAERAVREAREYAENIVETVRAPLLVLDKDLRVISVNRAFYETFQATPEETENKHVYDLGDQQWDIPRLRQLLQDILPKEGRLDDFEVEHEFPTIGRKTMLLNARRISHEAEETNKILLSVEDITERRRVEEALQENYQRSQAVLDTAVAGIITIDERGVIESFSKSAERLFGYPASEVIGKNVNMLMPSPYRDEHDEYLRHYRDTGEKKIIGIGREVTARRKGGDTFPIDLAISEVRLPGKRLFTGFINDITERKRAEAALRRSQAMLVEAQRIAHIGSWEWDLVQGKLYWSDEQYRIFGCEREKFTPSLKSFLKRVHPDDRESVSERFSAATSQDRPYTVDYRIVLPDGAIRFLHAAAQLEHDADGQPMRLIGTDQDITESHELSQQLTYQASHDALTGLINRREFEQRLERVLRTARAEDAEHALCYLDLDQFKVINDTCGHVAGDELLRQLGALLTERVRKRDTLARLGGDEFGVLLERCSLGQARRVSNALRKVIEGFRFLWEKKTFRVGVSIGVVLITKDSETTTNILKEADSACYAAKDEGRNRVHVYRADDAELAKRQGEMQWVARIQRGLEEERFHLDVQPITPVNGTADGGYYELLLRMKDEEGQVVPPGVFLAVAERYNLSTKLDHWVIATAFEWLTQHSQQLERLFLCSINLSGHSLGDEKFLEFVNRQFNETKLPPQKICFEVTETAAIANLASAARFIKVLKQRGCRFALDDFGSGLSSFAYLKNLPVDFLKIDGVFVKDIIGDPIALAMVNSINDIGHVMGKQTIAEFVENDAILKRLQEVGVDYAQGNYIGRPRPLGEVL